MAKRATSRDIFFDSDTIQVIAMHTDTLKVLVSRGNISFETTIAKHDFSPHAQKHFHTITPGAELTRGNCAFHVR